MSAAFEPVTPLVDAMRDPALFGSTFNKPSFWPWFAIAKLLDGTPLDQRETELFRTCTGRQTVPTEAIKRLVLLAGRRAGKDRFFSAVAVHRAGLAANWKEFMSAGEPAVVILLGADKAQAGILRRYCEGLLAASLLAKEVVRMTANAIEFRNGAVLETATNDARLIRGRSAIAVLGSECCHWRTDESSTSSDEEVVSAAAPSLSLCPDGGLLMLGSSVHRKRGYMYRRWQALHGNDDNDDICWLAPSNVMNPLLPQSVIDKAMAEDPQRAQAEYLSVWRGDLSDFVPSDVVTAATDFGVRERAPLPGVKYTAFCDAAGGTGSDSFALSITHVEKDGTVLVDVVRERKPRFIPAAVIAEFADLLRSYSIRHVSGDRYAAGFHADEWRRVGITYQPSDLTTSQNYLNALPLLLSGRARLVDDPTLRRQFCELERRGLTSGREIVSHAETNSAHDDMAAACAGAIVLASKPKQRIVTGYTSGDGFGPIYWPHLDKPDHAGIVLKIVDEHGNLIRESRVR